MTDDAQPKVYATFRMGNAKREERVSLELSSSALILVTDTGFRLPWGLRGLVEVPGEAGSLTVSDGSESPARLTIDDPAIASHLRSVAPQLASRDIPSDSHEDAAGKVFAQYADGKSAVIHRVMLQLSDTHLEIVHSDGARQQWSLIHLRALRDQAYSDGLVVKDGHGTTARLFIDNPNIAKHLRQVAPDLDQRAPVTNWGRITGWAGGAVASVALIIFVLVPIMADQLATYLPPEGEAALGDATFEQIRTALGEFDAPVKLCEDPEGRAALEKMVARLNPDPDLPYPVKLAVLDNDLVNAFALPGGRVVLFRGMIDKAEHPDEIASILAHEFGHVVNRDPTRDALRSAGSIGVLGLLFGDFAGGTVVLMLSNQLINAKYSQAAEAGADDYAHDLMTRANLDPGALGSIFQRLMDEYGDAEGIMAHLASHPSMRARIAAAQQAASSGDFGPPSITSAEWNALRGICGPRSVDDEGLNEDSTDTPSGGLSTDN